MDALQCSTVVRVPLPHLYSWREQSLDVPFTHAIRPCRGGHGARRHSIHEQPCRANRVRTHRSKMVFDRHAACIVYFSQELPSAGRLTPIRWGRLDRQCGEQSTWERARMARVSGMPQRSTPPQDETPDSDPSPLRESSGPSLGVSAND